MSLAIKLECYYSVLVDLLYSANSRREIDVLERAAEGEFLCKGDVIWLDKFKDKVFLRREVLKLNKED